MTTEDTSTKDTAYSAIRTLKLVMKQQERTHDKLKNLLYELEHAKKLTNIAYSDLLKITAPERV